MLDVLSSAVARRQRAGQRPRAEHERVVPRRDDADHAQRLRAAGGARASATGQVARRRGRIQRGPWASAWSMPRSRGTARPAQFSWRGRWPKSMAAQIASRSRSNRSARRTQAPGACGPDMRAGRGWRRAGSRAAAQGAVDVVDVVGIGVHGQKRLAMLRMSLVVSMRRAVPPSSTATKGARSRTLAPATSAPKTTPQRVCSSPSR